MQVKLLGIKRAMVVHSNGLDEISTMGVTKILHLKDGKVTPDELDPTEYGIPIADFKELEGGDAKANADIVNGIMQGTADQAKKDIVVLNAAAAIIVSGLAEDFTSAIEIADESVVKGKAKTALDQLIEVSNS